ncbi:acyl carrier protein [Owenweeksia hongkongensis]|uniref:acyl carrier protein n=1 Tax=Owenweeksia hongkongensis TaxID=253245 RepID=UPI003A93922F
MSPTEVSEELLKFIQENLVDASLELTAKTDLHNVAGIDSMAMVEIILFIERKFGVSFSDDELNPQIFNSVEVLAEAVLTHD